MSDRGYNHTFTVFTPTFNRAHTLPRVYASLRDQTFCDFEWLIVDDGSTDRTDALVEQWHITANFPIRYIRQSHAGKHVAFNRGVREAAGELFLCFDSDDGCVPTALERFKHHWDCIPSNSKTIFSGVTALAVNARGDLVGNCFPREITDSDALEIYFIHRMRGDKWGFHRTEVLRQFPFPEPEGLLFVTEAVVWFAIARRFKTRFVNECLRIYYQGESDRLTQLTQSTAAGRILFHKAVIEEYLDYLARAPLMFAKSLVNYSRYAFLLGFGPIGQLRRLRTIKGRMLVLPFLPVGAVLGLRDRLRAMN
jgi:glycosyltransferase involved in cell wall biosynthesis